jgi:hypothetical protein
MLKLMSPKCPPKKLNGEFHIAVQGFLNGYSRENVRLLLNQASLESGLNWQNKATTQDNNPFGMGRVSTRPTTQVGARIANDGSIVTNAVNYIGTYTNIGLGVADRFLWDSFAKIDGRTNQYIDAVIQQGYNPNPQQYQYNWLNTQSIGLTITKIHTAILGMLLAGFTVTTLMLNKKKRRR